MIQAARPVFPFTTSRRGKTGRLSTIVGDRALQSSLALSPVIQGATTPTSKERSHRSKSNPDDPFRTPAQFAVQYNIGTCLLYTSPSPRD